MSTPTFTSWAEFWAWAEQALSDDVLGAAAVGRFGRPAWWQHEFATMQQIARAVGWRAISEYEPMLDTLDEFAAWWLSGHPPVPAPETPIDTRLSPLDWLCICGGVVIIVAMVGASIGLLNIVDRLP